MRLHGPQRTIENTSLSAPLFICFNNNPFFPDASTEAATDHTGGSFGEFLEQWRSAPHHSYALRRQKSDRDRVSYGQTLNENNSPPSLWIAPSYVVVM